MSTKDILQSRFEQAKAELAVLEQSITPARAKLDAAAAEHEQARLKWQAVKAECVPKLQKPIFVELSREIAALANALMALRDKRRIEAA